MNNISNPFLSLTKANPDQLVAYPPSIHQGASLNFFVFHFPEEEVEPNLGDLEPLGITKVVLPSH